jgi:hypothetical protein
VIKRITFGDRASDVSRGPVAAMSAPTDARPVRATLCTALPELGRGETRHDTIAFEWFTDVAHAERFEAWRAVEGVRDCAACRVLVADELVVRGSAWLDRRWRDGGERLKHMALALRARDLSPAEFSERWRNHAGRLGRAGVPALVIPDVARGAAYVQNHPRPRPAGDWVYDGVNEVYFDDDAGLRARVDWFRENFDPADDDLVRMSWFVAAREEVLIP